MSLEPAKTMHARRSKATETGANDILCYADQGSFVGLRVLGRGPVLHLTWLYPQALSEADVQGFNERLAQGLLGRLLQRSPLPWGRHRWVASPVPAPTTWFTEPIPIERLPEWRNALVELPVDPEFGPGWRLAVQPLEGGGFALSLLVSHTIGDGQAVNEAVADAVAGRRLDHAFPAASWRWSPAMLARDFVESIRALPNAWRAMIALLRKTRTLTTHVSRPASHPRQTKQNGAEPATAIPLVQVIMDAQACEGRASELGVASNTLLSALAARIAFRIGRVDATGRVKLVLPVSERQPNDRRANALRAITIMTDPDACRSNPRVLQRELKAALASLLRHGDDVSPLFALIPFVPLWLARYLERMALGSDLPVGCSILGELPAELNHPCGEASLLQYSVLERFTNTALERLGGQLFLVCYSMGARMLVTVAGYAPHHITTRDELMHCIRDALADLGLEGNVG
jgi:diacylglycerol O-acyltransferase